MEDRVEEIEKEMIAIKASLTAMRLQNEEIRRENAANHSKLVSLFSKGRGSSSEEEEELSVNKKLKKKKRVGSTDLSGEELNEFRQSMRKVELPMFYGEDPAGWVTRAEVYFEVQDTSDAVRVKLSQLCMDGGTIHFFNAWANEEEEQTWERFKEALLERYGGVGDGSTYEQLQALCQEGDVDQYIQEFEFLVAQIPKLPDEQYFSYFISGLKDELKGRIRSLKSIGPLSRGRLINVTRAVEKEIGGRVKQSGGQGRWESRMGSGPNSSRRPNYPTNLVSHGLSQGGANSKEVRVGGVTSSVITGSAASTNDASRSTRTGPRDRGVKHLSYQELDCFFLHLHIIFLHLHTLGKFTI